MQTWPRKILHLDLDAFFCSVEELRNPELRGKPFAVGGRPDQRGVVASCSYAARQFGVRSAMPMAKALRLCPDLIIVHHNFGGYVTASRQVMELVRAITPIVEQISIDEAFFDCSGLSDDPEAIAHRLQAQVRDQLGLPCSLGIATNKLVAKIATDVGKFRARQAGISGSPNAITAVLPGEEAAFLAPLPADMLWGVGPKTAARLEVMGIHTIGDIATRTAAELRKLFGKNGEELAEHAKGIDNRELVMEHEAKSISQETTFARDVSDRKVLLSTLHELAAQVAQRLTKHELRGVTVKIKLRWPDFTTITRQTTLAQPTAESELIEALAEKLFLREWSPGKAVRLIGVGVSGLVEGPRQLGLWEAESEKEQRLRAALDEIKERHGEQSIARGPGKGKTGKQ